jgi:hypothetical protein
MLASSPCFTYNFRIVLAIQVDPAVRNVERATMEILREDLVNSVPALEQNITLLVVVVCHQKAMLTVSVERVTLAKDVTGKCDHFTVFNENLCIQINKKIRIQFQLVINLNCMQFYLTP